MRLEVRRMPRNRNNRGIRFDVRAGQSQRRRFRAEGLRRLADALHDATEGGYGTTHEWEVAPSASRPGHLDIKGPRLTITADNADLAGLLQEIDRLLDGDPPEVAKPSPAIMPKKFGPRRYGGAILIDGANMHRTETSRDTTNGH